MERTDGDGGEALPQTHRVAQKKTPTLERRGLVRLPQSLPAALDALAGDEDLKEAMGPALHDVYLRHKRFENDLLSDLSPEEQCERYRLVY